MTEPSRGDTDLNAVPSKIPLILVTGAAGWLGSRLVAALAGKLPDGPETATASRIRALVPAGADARALLDADVDVVTGDLRDAEARTAFLRGAKGGLLVHLAGVIHPRKVSEFEQVNTTGTLRLIEEASAAGLARAVVMSSNSPIGCNPHPDHRFDETSPYAPYMGYGRSKHLMEVGLRARIENRDPLEIVIIRAPWFYGPNQPLRQTRFFRMVKNGGFPIVGSGLNRRSMGYVDDLVRGILLAAAHPDAAGEIFWLADETPYAMNEIVDTVRTVLRDDFGMPVKDKTVRVPGVIGDVATLADATLQALGIYNQQIHVLSEMNKTIACDVGKARRVLGHAPRIGLREGMRRSVEWCLANGGDI